MVKLRSLAYRLLLRQITMVSRLVSGPQISQSGVVTLMMEKVRI